MRLRALPVLTVLLSATLSAPAWAKPDDPRRIRDEVVRLERAWSQAFLKHDLGVISKILADDYVGIDGRGAVANKATEMKQARLRPMGKGPTVLGEQLSDIRVRAYNNNTAVLTALNTVRYKAAGKESRLRYRRTTVWVKRGNQWQCVSFHGSQVLEKPKAPRSGTGRR